jgi:tetratricopeptide (TPR) repeat protein
MQLGYCYMMARRYDEAAAQYERTLELDPGYTFVKILLVWTSLFQGRYPEAEATFAQLPPNRRGRLRALLDASMGRRTDALRFLSETASGSKGPSGDPYYTAWIYAALGSRDEAIRWLMKARDERNPQFTQIKVDPAMDSLRADQRFQEMVRRMNFPQ